MGGGSGEGEVKEKHPLSKHRTKAPARGGPITKRRWEDKDLCLSMFERNIATNLWELLWGPHPTALTITKPFRPVAFQTSEASFGKHA